jgi:hypothetical protein
MTKIIQMPNEEMEGKTWDNNRPQGIILDRKNKNYLKSITTAHKTQTMKDFIHRLRKPKHKELNPVLV